MVWSVVQTIIWSVVQGSPVTWRLVKCSLHRWSLLANETFSTYNSSELCVVSTKAIYRAPHAEGQPVRAGYTSLSGYGSYLPRHYTFFDRAYIALYIVIVLCLLPYFESLTCTLHLYHDYETGTFFATYCRRAVLHVRRAIVPDVVTCN